MTIDSDGHALPAVLFTPEGAAGCACVLHGATGVPRDYYAAFAEWVANVRGAACLIYGYRDAELDAAGLKASRADMAAWGARDQNAALSWICAEFPDAEIRVVGHSLGGFMTMFHEQAGRVARLSAICSGPAYWRRTPFPQILAAWAFWYLVGPVATTLAGYLPARVGGIGAAIPAAAYWQWRRWCTNPDLHKVDWARALPMPDLQAFRGDLRLVAAADDWVIAPSVVHDLARFYPAARSVERLVMDPRVAGRPLGHLAAFRPSASAVWPMIWGD